MRYNEQLLSTDIAYNFGDNKNGGIQFPMISFCQFDVTVKNTVMRDCGSNSIDFISAIYDCLKSDKNFKITSLFESHKYQPENIFHSSTNITNVEESLIFYGECVVSGTKYVAVAIGGSPIWTSM